jgi:two-component SAPR family response regulator
MLFVNERVSLVLDIIQKQGIPDPKAEPERALLYAHALYLFGDYAKSLRVYSAVTPSSDHDAQQLWGLANVNLRMGNLAQSRHFLQESLAKNPADWLLPRIYNSLNNLYLQEGNFEEAYRTLEKGIAVSERGPQLIMRWIFEGQRGVLQTQQGYLEEGLLSLGRSMKQLLAQHAVLSSGYNLINLGVVYDSIGDFPVARHYYARAEKHFQEAGCKTPLIFLRLTQGSTFERVGTLEKAQQYYNEAHELLWEYPTPELEIILNLTQARLNLKKGKISEALQLVHDAQRLIQEKGLILYEDTAAFYEGSFLVRSGAIQEGLAVLNKVAAVTEARKKFGLLSTITLYLAYGHAELNQLKEAVRWMTKCLAAIETCHSVQEVIDKKDILIPLLLHLGYRVPITDSLSTLIVKLRHPSLVKRLLRHSPYGKVLFLRSLKVHDARHFLKEIDRLRNHPEKEVQRTVRFILQGWIRHSTYRIFALGPLRVFFEGRLLSDKDWILPGVKRLFLFFITHPRKWHETEAILEALWPKPDSEKKRKVLISRFYDLRHVIEPWHLPDIDYVFLQSRHGAYGFFPAQRFWMDAQEFEEQVTQGDKARLSRNFRKAREAYRRALDFYLGDYLEEFPYDEWIFQKRDYLRELYFRTIMNYSTLECDSGNPNEARRVLEEALFKDPARTDCIVFLIQVLHKMKLSHEALMWGEKYVQFMKKKLKEKPAPEVIEVLNQLK